MTIRIKTEGNAMTFQSLQLLVFQPISVLLLHLEIILSIFGVLSLISFLHEGIEFHLDDPFVRSRIEQAPDCYEDKLKKFELKNRETIICKQISIKNFIDLRTINITSTVF